MKKKEMKKEIKMWRKLGQEAQETVTWQTARIHELEEQVRALSTATFIAPSSEVPTPAAPVVVVTGDAASEQAISA